jgi:hypothetical protein
LGLGQALNRVETASDVQQQMNLLSGAQEELEEAVNQLGEALDRGGVLRSSPPEAVSAGPKLPEPNSPLAGAIHEAARRAIMRAAVLRDLRTRLAV